MSAPRQTTGLVRALLLTGVLVLVAESAVFCLYGASVYDEGGYLYEGWIAVAHGQLPFRDFHAKLPPLPYYLYGIGQALFGPSVLVGRIEAALFMFAGLWLAGWTARRLAGPWAGVLLVWLLVGNPFALNYYLHAYAVAPTGFFVALACALLIVPRPGPAALLGAGAAVGGMLLCRHDMLPLALVLWVVMLWQYPASVPWRVAGVACSGVLFGLVMLPFALQAPDNVLWTLSVGRLGPQVPSVGGYGEAALASPRVILWHALMFLRAYAGIALALGVALAAGAMRRTPVTAGAREPRPVAWMLTAALVLWLGHIPAALATGGNVFYLLDPYLFFPVAVSAAVLLVGRHGALAALTEGPARLAQRALVAVAVFAVIMPVFTGPGPRLELPLHRPSELAQMRVGAAALARTIPPGETIFTIDDPHQFLQARLLLPVALTHELFAYRETPATDLVRRMHLYNDEMIREWLTGGARYAVISAEPREFMRHSGRYSGGARLDAFIMGLLQANYELVTEVPGTWAGPMRIYRWRGDR